MFFGLAAATLGAAPPPVAPGPVVELPPMLVEAAGTSAPRWLYGRIPGFEVLSCASSEVTEDLTLRLYRLRAELGQLVPASLQVQRDEPFTLILYPQSRAESLSQALNEHLARGQARKLSQGRVLAPPNLDLDDPDSDLLFSVVEDRSTKLSWSPGSVYTGGSRYDGIVYSPEYISRLFSDRAPALPPWFIYGMARFYGAISTIDDGLEFAPDDWLSPESAEAAHRGGADAFRATLPLAELFRGQLPAPPGDAAAREQSKLWLAEAELFVRWSIDGPAHRQYQARAALWKFAEAASHAPVTEDLFRQCFGMGYSDARDEMSDYLARAVRRPVEVDLDSEPALPELRLGVASPADIHRIKGDFARRTLRLVRESHPALLPIYVRQAREVLQGAYDEGERDPRLVADLGLLCREAGSIPEAGRYLEEGFRTGTMRPNALAELARLRLATYLEAAREGSRRPPLAAVESILAPIRAARRLQPPQLLAYLVVADLCGLDPAQARPEERALLAEGADYFPSSTSLILAAVRQDGAFGDRARALRLADLGLWMGTDPALLAQLKSARNALQAKPTK
jgi:hypothetical protein